MARRLRPPSSAAGDRTPLIELLERTESGKGGTLVVDDAETLREARRLARERDMTVRRARGDDAPFSTVMQLFDVQLPLAQAEEATVRSAVLTLIGGLARHGRVALLIDATRKADEESLRILASVAERAENLPVALIVAGDAFRPLLRPPPPPPPPRRSRGAEGPSASGGDGRS